MSYFFVGDKTETNSNVIKKLENDNQEEIVTNTETIVFETEGDINEVDENVIIPKIAVPETSEVPFQDNEVKFQFLIVFYNYM